MFCDKKEGAEPSLFLTTNSVSGRQSLHFLERQGAKEKPAQRVLMSG